MQTIYLLCEKNIPYSTVNSLYEHGIKYIEQIILDNACLNEFFNEYSLKRNQIESTAKKVIDINKEHSVYELVGYGLSLKIADKLFEKRVKIEELADDVKSKYSIGNATFEKIKEAFSLYIKENKINLKLNDRKLYTIIYSVFEHDDFSLNDLVSYLENNLYDVDKLENFIDELLKQKLLQKKGDSVFNVPYDIDELENFGLKKTLIQYLKDNKVSIDELDESLIERLHLTPTKYQKIINAYRLFAKKNNYKKNLTEIVLLNEIKNEFNNKQFVFEELEDLIERKDYSYNNLNDLVDALILKKKLKFKDGTYNVKYSKLVDVLKSIPNDNNHYDIVTKKLSGFTLEEIGQEYGLTRERIRQIYTKEINKISTVQEDSYSEYYCKYNFNCSLFTELFKVENYVYFYLKEKYTQGEAEPSELLETNILNKEQADILRKKYNLIKYNDENIIASKISILIAFLKKMDRQVEYSELVENYNSIIKNNNLPLELITDEDFRNVDAILGRADFVLNTLGKSYRYYNCKEIEDNDKNELKKLLDIEPGVYSSELFFNDNPLLMKKLDIRDEYELHNLFRKVLGNFDENIVYSRMPDINIYCDNKLEFIENQILELSPVSIDEFVDYIYLTYGHKKATFRAYIMTNFNHYINGNTLISDCPLFDDEQSKIMQQNLTEDVYSTLTIKQMLTELFDVNDFKLLNNLNFNKLGYRVRGNYIMRNSISNLESHLRNQIIDADYYTVPSEMKKIGSTYSSYLYKFIYEMLLFKIDDDKYMTIKKLNEIGITKNHINEFINKINNYINKNEYFNLYTLKHIFSNDILFSQNFPECFYETIIILVPNVKSISLKNNIVFIKTNDSPSREKFINSFVDKNKMYIRDIKKQLLDKYNIDLQESYIRQFINKNKFYFDLGTDCIYLSKEDYENEINQWDILKYID